MLRGVAWSVLEGGDAESDEADGDGAGGQAGCFEEAVGVCEEVAVEVGGRAAGELPGVRGEYK